MVKENNFWDEMLCEGLLFVTIKFQVVGTGPALDIIYRPFILWNKQSAVRFIIKNNIYLSIISIDHSAKAMCMNNIL